MKTPNILKPKLLLLTGAGFSIDFMRHNNRKLNTDFLTKLLIDSRLFSEYTTILCTGQTDDIARLNTIQKLCSTVFDTLNQADLSYLNFEHVIYGLECLLTPNTSENEPTEIEIIIQELLSGIKSGEFNWQYIYALKSFVLDVVRLFQKNDDEDVIGHFKRQLNKSYTTHHFTLNYDDLFVTNTDISNYYPKSNYEIEHHMIDVKSYFLHGSVYFWRGETLGVGNKEVASDNRKGLLNSKSYFNAIGNTTDKSFYDPLIIGISKRMKLENNGYKHMFEKFKTTIREVDELLIVGYSFNDEHINEVLMQIDNTSLSKITIVDKKEECDAAKFEESVTSHLNPDSIDIEFHLKGAGDFIDKWITKE